MPLLQILLDGGMGYYTDAFLGMTPLLISLSMLFEDGEHIWLVCTRDLTYLDPFAVFS